MMKPTYLPFVRGIQDADADSADTQTGKLADACNVHVHPERANVLSLRPRFVGKVNVDTNARVCVAGGRPAFVGEDDFGRLQDDGTYFTESSDSQKFRNFAVVSTSEYVTRQLGDVLTVAYAEQTNGDNVAMVAVETNVATFAVYYQRVANGRKYAEQLWTSVGSNQPRMYIFPRVGGAGFLSVVNDAFSGAITMRLSTTNNGTFGSSITLVGTVLLDMVQNPSTNTYSYIYTAGGGILFRRVDETGATVEGPYTINVKVNPAYAGLVGGIGTEWHVWHGGYPVDANDTLYVSRVIGGLVFALASWANATTPAPIGRVISVGGGAVKIDATTNGTGSYCYLAGGNGDDPRVGRLFFTNASGVSYSQYCAPILPMGRLWCDTSFFGVRIWGLQQKIGGCWELTPGTETSTNTNVRCRPIAYHTVTRALPPATGVQALRQFSIYQTTDNSKALLFGRDSSSITLVEVGYDQPTRGLTVNNSSFDVLIGGVPRYWDGVTFVPVGIPQAPLISSISPSGGAGTLAAGTYVYTMVWEWVDAAGNRQQSPAQLETVTVPALGIVSLEIHPGSIPYDERIVGLRPGMRGVVYRTDPGGTVLKRGELYLDFSLTTFGPPSGLWAADYFIVADTGAVDFSLGEPLYMSPGGANELAATAMEETFLMRPYSDRIIGVSLSFPDQLWYTKTIQVGRAIEPNQALYFRLPEVATGLAVQDGNVYWFSANNCWAFVPQFADDTGLGGGAIDPVPLATGVGCEATNSIVETPVGVFFIGPRGPWVIPRGGGAPSFVGIDVEEFFRDFPVCRGAVYNALFSEVVFAMETSSGNNHCLMIYNHVMQQWFRWMIGDDAMSGFGTAAVKSLRGGIVYADDTLSVAGVDGGTLSILHLTDNTFPEYDQFLTSDDRQIHPYIEFKNFYPSGGPAELFRANRFALDCQSIGSTMWVSSSATDGAGWATGFQMPVDENPIYRFPVQKVRGIRFRIWNTWNGDPSPTFQDESPAVYNGVTLYTSPLGRAKAGSTYYRG